MSDKAFNAPADRMVFHADPLPVILVPALFAAAACALAWWMEGLTIALWILGAVSVLAAGEQILLRLLPPLVIESGRATARLRRGTRVRFDGASMASVQVRSQGIFGRGVEIRPGLVANQGHRSRSTFIGPLRDPTAAWHALDRLRRTGER